jgi:endoglucanase Acf2
MHRLIVLLVPAVVGAFFALSAHGQLVPRGAGGYLTAPRTGDPSPPAAAHRTARLQAAAAQTNQWYSGLIFESPPQPIYAQPLSIRPTAEGLEIGRPIRQVVPTERRDVEIHYPHRRALLVRPAAFAAGTARLDRVSDWAIDIEMGRDERIFTATVGHGLPFTYLRISGGGLTVLGAAGALQWVLASDPRVLKIRSAETSWAVFLPTGGRWGRSAEGAWTGSMPAGRDYASIAALPDDSDATLELFTRHAYAFVSNTRAESRYDATTSQVRTRFSATTQAMEGGVSTPLLGLYPHHWFGNESVLGRLGSQYETVRGQIRLLGDSGFETVARYTGFVPFWPQVNATDRADELREVIRLDVRNARRMMLEIGNGPYWQGKGLQRIVKLLDVVEQQGDLKARDELLRLLKTRMESWLSGQDRKNYFVYNRELGALIAYPEEYFSVMQLNDHHFHYGYWIRAAAEVGLRDRDWISQDKWGQMIDLLVADIASTQRDSARFPYLRTFDAYEGHSWASGIGMGEHGNNQEASSEAINAWAGLIIWGEVTGNTALRDLGICLYVTEIQAVNHYWFDIHRQVLAPEYRNEEVSMLFGAKYAHNTWWTDEPRQIKGINLLPITTASTYLATDPAFVKRNLEALENETAIYASRLKRANPPDIWQDLFAKYQGLTDPAAGLARWNRWGAVEAGDTRSHTLHWLMSLGEMGTPDLSVTADTTFFSVMRHPRSGARTYLAYNARSEPITVRFSDGHQMQVAPGTLGKVTR